MLVLSRKKGETIVIGDDIEITIVAVEGEMIRLGVKAPREIPVHRKEIYEAIQESNKEAIPQSKRNEILTEFIRNYGK